MNTIRIQPVTTTNDAVSKCIARMAIVPVETRNVYSAMEFAVTLFQAVQQALAPIPPRNATAWFAHYALISLHRLDYDPAYRQAADGYWRELIGYSIRDFARHSPARLCFADLARMLNAIYWEQGHDEVLELIETLDSARQRYPCAFAA